MNQLGPTYANDFVTRNIIAPLCPNPNPNYFERCKEFLLILASIDVSQAFDSVRYDTLFIKLSKIIAGVTLSLLIVWYVGHTAGILWAGIMSDSFPVSIGVCQGSVLSPLLGLLISTSVDSSVFFYKYVGCCLGANFN